MKIKIIDDNHFMIVANNEEVTQYSSHTRVLIDNRDSFVCNSSPSDASFKINKPIGGTLFNIPLNIKSSPFTTNELLIVYLELADATYPVILPCYNNVVLLELVADKSGVFVSEVTAENAKPIVLYYAFKLALSIADYFKAIKMYNRLVDSSVNTENCNCNGH